jgi:hypothetical protein
LQITGGKSNHLTCGAGSGFVKTCGVHSELRIFGFARANSILITLNHTKLKFKTYQTNFPLILPISQN